MVPNFQRNLMYCFSSLVADNAILNLNQPQNKAFGLQSQVSFITKKAIHGAFALLKWKVNTVCLQCEGDMEVKRDSLVLIM